MQRPLSNHWNRHYVRDPYWATRDQWRNSSTTPTPATWELVEYCSKSRHKRTGCDLLQQNYVQRRECVTRWELLTTVKTLEHFLTYLYVQEFHVRTEHFVLIYLLSFRNVQGPTARGVQRLQEWTSYLDTVMSSNTRTQTSFPDDHVSKSAFTVNRLSNLQMAQGRL